MATRYKCTPVVSYQSRTVAEIQHQQTAKTIKNLDNFKKNTSADYYNDLAHLESREGDSAQKEERLRGLSCFTAEN